MDRVNPDLGLSERIVHIKLMAAHWDELHAKKEYLELARQMAIAKASLTMAEYCINDLIRPNGT